MAAEITVQSSLAIVKGNLIYRSQPTTFRADMLGTNGPTPGGTIISTSITVISLASLTAMGGWCRMQNIDQTNFVSVGPYDVDAGVFLPFIDLLPGETMCFRLSQFLNKELTPGTGTGVADAIPTTVAAKANKAPVELLVEAFDK